MVWPNPQEVVTLIVDGMNYRDWETVQVTHRWKQNPYFTVRFTCSEGMPLAKNFAVMRIIPGQWCQVLLGGILALSGWIYSRQVYVDARRHYIEIQAGSNDLPASYSSVITKTSEFKKITAQDFATKVLKPFGLKFDVEGGQLPKFEFPRIGMQPGVAAIEAIEDILRQLGHFPLTTRVEGNVVVALAGPSGGEDVVREGDNMLEGREVIFNPGMASGTYGIVQMEGHDDKHGAKVSHEPFKGLPFSNSFQGAYAPLVQALEHPVVDPQVLSGRTTAEQALNGSDEITVTVTVRGWMRPSGGLWQRNQIVRVISPMLVMDGSIQLRAKTVTFTQDDRGGTRTILELCNDLAMNAAGITSGSQ